MFDVCVIGHVTRDVIKTDGEIQREIPGGTAYYTPMALRSLGCDVAVITKVARADQPHVLSDLKRSGIALFCHDSDETTTFENIYARDDRDMRTQRVTARASPFSPQDVPPIAAKIFHVGPLTNTDISAELLQQLSRRGNLISLDVQGLCRTIVDGEVRGTDWQEKEVGLRHIDILKADENEVRILCGEYDMENAARKLTGFGPREIIITLAGRGSLIFGDGKVHRIPAVSPRKAVDSTGCGDTYVAGYLYQRLQSRDITTAGAFASVIATAKLERFGAWTGREADLEGIGHDAG